MLKPTYFRGDAIPVPVLEEVCGLRAEVARLRPEVSAAADRDCFVGALRAADTVCVLRDQAGQAQGLWATQDRVIRAEGRRCLLIYTDQLWLRRSHRGDPGFILSALRQGLTRAAVTRCHRLYVGGLTNPLSYNALNGWFESLRCLAEGDVPPAERAMLDEVAKGLGPRWDPANLRARLLVLPPEVPDCVCAHPARAARVARYEALNPDWASGWGLPMVGRVPWRRVSAMPVRALGRSAPARWVRRRRGGPH